MNNEEFMKLCEEFKAQGLDDKDILNVIYQMFKDEKIEKEDMVKMANSLGFELSEEFRKEDKEAEDAEGLSPEEVEDAQEVEKSDSDSEKEDSESEKEDSESDSDEEDEKSWKKNFGLD